VVANNSNSRRCLKHKSEPVKCISLVIPRIVQQSKGLCHVLARETRDLGIRGEGTRTAVRLHTSFWKPGVALLCF
jgi:hypothetical protein